MSNVRDFGATGDGKTDDTDAIQHAINDGDGAIEFPRGEYRLTRTLQVDLSRRSRTSFHGSGGTAKVLMDGSGPAVFLKATHASTANPDGFRPEEWQHERMPTVRDIEIEGRHEKADGIRIEGVMQPTLTGVLVRRVRTAVHVTRRARNLIVDHCHFYHNTGAGVHLDGVNLHQAIVSDSHISYCRLGGIRIENSEIRNLQITGNDIEYNNNRSHDVPDADGVPTAEIYIDCRKGTVREGTIASNTIQATPSPNGANIRMVGSGGDEPHRVSLWAISGNLIGSQTDNIHLTSVRNTTISGNVIYNADHRNLFLEGSKNVVVGPNQFGRRNELVAGIRIVDSENCTLSGLLIRDAEADRAIDRDALLELVRCRRVTISGVQVLEPSPCGIAVRDCRDTILTGCTVLDERQPKQMKAAIRWQGDGAGNLVAASRIGSGTNGAILGGDRVRLAENVLD